MHDANELKGILFLFFIITMILNVPLQSTTLFVGHFASGVICTVVTIAFIGVQINRPARPKFGGRLSGNYIYSFASETTVSTTASPTMAMTSISTLAPIGRLPA